MKLLIFNSFIKFFKNIINIDVLLSLINNRLNYIEKRLDKLEDRVDNIYNLILELIKNNKK